MKTMQLCMILTFLGVAVLSDASQPAPKGLDFVGVGYNLLKGNPEGGDLSIGGIDPGLLTTRKIFKLTYKTGKTSSDRKYSIPDQVSFAHRSSCVLETKKEVVFGSRSYQKKLESDVEASGYEKMNKETSDKHYVFYEEKKVCNRGRARYLLASASFKKFPVSDEFSAAVCVLPENYDERAYFNFIEKWGTHIVEEVELGERRIERSRSSSTAFTLYAMQNAEDSVSASGEFLGFSSSLKVDMNKFRESMSEGTKFGEHKKVYTSGGPELPEPIKLKLLPLYVAFDFHFYQALEQEGSSRCGYTLSFLGKRKANVKKILNEYPRLRNVHRAGDPEVRIPLTWPTGTYGLPETTEGCPKASGFSWHKGIRHHDTKENNKRSRIDLAGRYYDRGSMEQWFCIKTQPGSAYSLPWPKGQYCIFKKGKCPGGFKEEYIVWKDEYRNNQNSFSGQLPDGIYEEYATTKIYYCCRSDGYATNPIFLPTDSTFALFKSNTHLCQQVKGLQATSQWFYWDCDDEKGDGVKYSNKRSPYGNIEASKKHDVKIEFCYYHPPPINGGWSEWGAWDFCWECLRFRQRTCTNPPPRYTGKYCTGRYSEMGGCCNEGKYTDWYTFGDSEYYVAQNPTLRWDEARKTCKWLGGDLATIRSAEENSFIWDLISKQKSVTEFGAWIGLYRKGDSKFYWVDDTPLQYTEWKPGQPDNSGGVEDCVNVNGGKWNDLRCDAWGDSSRAPVTLCQRFLKDIPVWFSYGNSRYYIDDTPGIFNFHWDDARKACQKLGGDLAIIRSAEENKFIWDLVSRQERVAELGAWIGLFRKGDSKFYWVDESPLLHSQYSEWKPGQPDNSAGVENCVHIIEGKWNDLPCNAYNNFAIAPVILCQKTI